MIFNHNKNGNLISSYCLDKNGKHCLSKLGFNKIIQKYNKNNLLIEESYFDEDNNPTYRYDLNVHKIIFGYDKKNIESWECYDVNHNPYYSKQYWSKYKQIVNAKGQIIEQSTMDKNYEPIYDSQKVTTCKYEYYSCGNNVRVSYYGIKEKCYNNEKIHAFTAKYDVNGNPIESTYFDIYNQKCNDLNGVCTIKNEYNNVNLIASSKYYDSRGNRLNSKNGAYMFF